MNSQFNTGCKAAEPASIGDFKSHVNEHVSAGEGSKQQRPETERQRVSTEKPDLVIDFILCENASEPQACQHRHRTYVRMRTMTPSRFPVPLNRLLLLRTTIFSSSKPT